MVRWRVLAGAESEPLLDYWIERLPEEHDVTQFDRITQHPGVMGGKPCIRGMRVTVAMIVGQIGSGYSIEQLLADYPYLEREDVIQALRYAAS
jgi:uncharacterized protein (DUF433 family)